ncbi:MAG: hypothetical protein H0T15_02055, partial [Thermoleophilaceae bacterium]|nr:hypothetical protein [Thermoleophilaceae bacterium]
MVICVLHPRLALLAALGDRRELLAEPVALAPEPGAPAFLGQASAAAEAFGIVAGMRVGEALARCPDLRLVPPDPEGVRELWSAVLDAVENIGAAPESDLPGEAYFEAEGLTALHRGGLESVLAAARRALGRGMRVAAAPSRFSSYVAATLARPRRAFPPVSVAEVRAFLAPRPVELLRARPELVTLAEVLD